MSPQQTPQSRKSWTAPLAAGLLVVLLLGGVTLTILNSRAGSDAGAGGPLPVLRLTSPVGAAEADAPVSRSGREHYLLAGSLPSGRPDAAPVYRFSTGTAETKAPAKVVSRLARALGMPGTAQRTPAGWQLVNGSRVLTVEDGGNWMWRLDRNEITPDTRVKCFRAPCPAYPDDTATQSSVGGQPGPNAAEAERVASDALRALRLPIHNLSTVVGAALTEVQAPRQVGGVDAVGFGTAFSVARDRKIYGGYGVLGQPRADSTYPLITAAEAFQRLQSQPYAEILLCRPQAGGGCAPSPQEKVTGAKLGLVTATDANGTLLVPAWLFTVAGRTDPMPVVAVESRYLGPPAPMPSSQTPRPDTGSSAGPVTGGGLPGVRNPATPPPG